MTVEQNTEIGARIKQTRKALNLKQKDFAKELNISVSSLSEIETGKYKAGIEFLTVLSKKFNVNLYFVLFGEGDMFISPTASSYFRASKFAVNLEDVRDFLYHFERSPILQYFILSQYKTRMMSEGDMILKEIEKLEKKNIQTKNRLVHDPETANKNLKGE
jgi:transcriptional regulator with XRE-family HTH domain